MINPRKYYNLGKTYSQPPQYLEKSLKILSVIEGRDKESVKKFFRSIPWRLKNRIKGICCDMHDGYVYAALEALPKVSVIIDRFHVAKLYRKSFVELRKSELIRLRKKLTKSKYTQLKEAIAILCKNVERVTPKEREELEKVFKVSPVLKKGYRFCRKLTSIYNSHIGRRKAGNKINEWITTVEASQVKCFDRFIKTLTKYRTHIIQYFKDRNTSGFVEGFNNKIKVIKRRCYGIFDKNTLFRRILLDTEGYDRFLNTCWLQSAF